MNEHPEAGHLTDPDGWVYTTDLRTNMNYVMKRVERLGDRCQGITVIGKFPRDGGPVVLPLEALIDAIAPLSEDSAKYFSYGDVRGTS